MWQLKIDGAGIFPSFDACKRITNGLRCATGQEKYFGTGMTTVPQVQQHPASVDAYIRHGWSLVPIPPGTKGPTNRGWNLRESALKSQTDLLPGFGIGLAHAYSGTMALDVDVWDRAAAELAIHGVDLNALYDAPDAVIVDSGRQGHGKLLYAMPFGLALPSKKLIDVAPDGKRFNYLDFRCATANNLTVQDVLPPSIHPDTHQPYRWAGRGHWSRLPEIPTELLNFWNYLLEQDRARSMSMGESIDASWEEIRGALEHISPDVSREEWINIGMALHWAGTATGQIDQALYLWNEWSSQSQTKYPGERDILTQWSSFRPDKATSVKLGTLFHIARRHGWIRPAPDVSTLFSPTTVATPKKIITDLRPPAPELDLTLFPRVLATRADEIAESVGCDPLVPLFAGLGAVCGAVDARIRLELMPGFRVPPILWLMTLGDPADKKSPGSRPMFQILKEIESEDRPRFAKEQLNWESKEAQYATAKKAFIEFAQTPEALLSNTVPPAVPELPPPPVSLKITVSDITSQKLVRSAADRPRGLLCYLDEMNAWVRKITDKTSGEDRSAWVVSYEGEHYEMDRVGSGSIHASNLAVSIFGNIQPRVFKDNVHNLSSDGLLQRFIPIVLRGNKTKLGHPVPDYMTNKAEYDHMVRTVYGLPPIIYRLSEPAYNAYREFQEWYEQAKQDERLLKADNTYMTAFGKLEGLAGRLILLFHVIEAPYDIEVSVDVTQRVIRLVRGYIIPSLRYALGEVGGLADDSLDQWMTDHIIHICDEKQMVTLRELKRSARRPLENTNEWLKDQLIMDSMLMLEQAGWVMQVEEQFNKRHVVWAINPELPNLFKDYREKVIKAKQRHVDEIYKLAVNSPNYKGRKLVKGYDPDTMDEE